jgi:nucleotide-binding universal stress UspA family protein
VGWALALGRAAHAPVTFLHVLEGPPSDGRRAWRQEDALRRLRAAEHLPSVPGCPVNEMVVHGRPPAEILRQAEALRASHIVMGAAAPGAPTRRVVRDATVPVLTVPSKESEP